jgi:hypothetical protein
LLGRLSSGLPSIRIASHFPSHFPSSSFLSNAFQGYFHMPPMGTENIKRPLFAPGRSLVAMDLGAVLPERT